MKNKPDYSKLVTLSYILLTDILTLVFIVLKVCGVVDWSWWLVFLPLILFVGGFVILMVVCIILAVLFCNVGHEED